MSADAGASGGLRPLARDFFWLAGSQVLLKLLALAFGIFAVRCLGAADYGRYAAALAFAGLFAVATGPGAASFGTREMARDAALVGALVPDVAALRGLLATGVVPLLALVAWATGRAPEAIAAIVLAGLGLPLQTLVATFDSALVARGQARAAAACAGLRQALFVGLGSVALLTGGRVLALLAVSHAAVVARALVALVLLRRMPGVKLMRPDPARWPALLRRLWPFGVEGASDLLGLHAPLALLSLVASEETTGHYAAAFALVLAITPFAQSLGTALTPRLSAPGGRALLPGLTGAALRLTLGLGLPSAALLMGLADSVTTLVYGAAFAPAAPALRVLALTLPLSFAAETLRAALLALRLERLAARAAVAGALVALALTWLLGGAYGARGAAWAAVALRLVSVVAFVHALLRVLPPHEARQALGWSRA